MKKMPKMSELTKMPKIVEFYLFMAEQVACCGLRGAGCAVRGTGIVQSAESMA